LLVLWMTDSKPYIGLKCQQRSVLPKFKLVEWGVIYIEKLITILWLFALIMKRDIIHNLQQIININISGITTGTHDKTILGDLKDLTIFILFLKKNYK
jgi:hypothetical protein